MPTLLHTLLKGLGKRTFKYITSFIVLAYFILTLLYSLPFNTARIAWQGLISFTIGSYFIQNWSLFAPNPISTNKNLLIFPLTDSIGYKALSDQKINWIDISQPLADNYHKNRLSAYERLSRVQKEAFHLYLGYNSYLYFLKRACNTGDTQACADYEIQLDYDKKMALNMFQRIGSSACNQLFRTDSITHYVMAYKIHQPVGWSKRYEEVKPSYDFGIIGTFKIDRNIEKSVFFENDK